MIDPDEYRCVRLERRDQPFGDAPPRPVFLRAGRWLDLNGWGTPIRHEDAQTLEARSRRLGTRIVDADVASKAWDPVTSHERFIASWTLASGGNLTRLIITYA